MSPHASPCHGLYGAAWNEVRSNALAALDAFGSAFAEHGWQAWELFDVHPTAGSVRVDACGALMLHPARMPVTVHEDRIAFGALTGYRYKPGKPRGVLIWEAGRG